MTDTQAHTRQFIVFSQAWYRNSILKLPSIADEITLTLYDKAHTTQGEMTIRWYKHDRDTSPAACLEEFFEEMSFDSWSLANIQDVFDKLAELSETPSVQQVAELLISCGFEDATPRVRPNN